MVKIQKEIVRFIQAGLLGLLVLLGMSTEAQAVPSFARQTGENCVACHTSFYELTPYGREFKLNGYTFGEFQWLPFSAMVTASSTTIKNNNDGTGAKVMPRDGAVQFDATSVFIAGKVNDYAGGFVQWTYQNHRDAPDGPQHHSSLDNTDLRAVYNLTAFDKNLLVGMTLNNNPGVQDVWNTGPAWSFPYNASIAVGLPGSTGVGAAMLDVGQPLGHTVAGLGAYFWWDRHLYGELTMYGDANRSIGFLSAGNTLNGAPILKGHNNPYWRLAWNEEWGANSLMVGTYGMRVGLAGDGTTNRFTDTAIDAQYQYISDPGIFSAQASFLHEKQEYNDVPKRDSLNIIRAKASYLYDRTYGATLGFVNVAGSSDPVYASQSCSGDVVCNNSPGSRYYIMELDYNYNPQVRFLAQYTAFTKLDQSVRDPNATGRKASDNNTLWLATWFAF